MTHSAPRLAQLQHRFQGHLCNPAGDDLVDLVADGPRVPRSTRLYIYANAYRARLVEAMDADFGQLHVFLGDEQFERLIHAYLDAHPSRNPSLRWFGQDLPRFLREAEPYRQHPGLAELAEFEWALCHAFDASDVTPLDSARLAALAPEDWAGLRLAFHPTLRELPLGSNAPEIWQVLNENPQTTPPPFQWSAEPRCWLVWRQELRLMYRAAKEDEAHALARFRGGAGFADVCEALCRWHAEEEVPLRAVGLLQQWLSEGLITAIEVSPVD